MQLSIVATLYMSAPYLEEFVSRCDGVAQRLDVDYEIVLVDDGSPDDSLVRAIDLTVTHRALRVVQLSRNFGHHRAMMAGLSQARGERVFLIDADLEEAPELLASFWAEMESRPEVDVVYGQLAKRKGGWFERVSGEAFYSAINAMTGLDVPRNVITARLMRRGYVEALVEHKEREIFIGGLWAYTGFNQLALPVEKKHKGETTYNLRRKLSILVNSITAFSSRPLQLIFLTGLAIFSFALLYAFYLIVASLFMMRPPSGWTSLIVSVWLLGGLTIFFLGVIGIYLAKIFTEVKQRPYATVRQTYQAADHEER